MNKLIYILCGIPVIFFVGSVFMFGREYQANRCLSSISEVQKIYCESDYYILNKSKYPDINGFCSNYN